MYLDAKRRDIKTLLEQLDKLEKENAELVRKAEKANQGTRLVRYQLKEILNDLDDYERLLEEENEFTTLSNDIDRVLSNPPLTDIPEVPNIIINNTFQPNNTNNNKNVNT